MLHPKYFGPQLMEMIKQKLCTDVEGSYSQTYGVIIAMMNIVNIGDGIAQPGLGFVIWPVEYWAIVCRPIKGEVVDAIVTKINKV